MNPDSTKKSGVFVAGAFLGAFVLVATPVASYANNTSPEEVVRFEFEGAPAQPWVVPEGVCEVTVTAVGASGGLGGYFAPGDWVGIWGPEMHPGIDEGEGHGLGGSVSVTLKVTPGSILQADVGGAGGEIEGGYGGGGRAGDLDLPASLPPAGTNQPLSGGGGGMTSVTLEGSPVLIGGGGTATMYRNNAIPAWGFGGHGGSQGTIGKQVNHESFDLVRRAEPGGAARRLALEQVAWANSRPMKARKTALA